MALFGLFGGKKNEPQQGDFFLDFEEAQTFGNAEYMKQTKTIKRTFPKVKGKESGKTIVSQVSSDSMRKMDGKQAANPSAFSSTTSSSSEPAAEAPKMSTPKPNLKVDSSMDMFRSMAKNIKR